MATTFSTVLRLPHITPNSPISRHKQPLTRRIKCSFSEPEPASDPESFPIRNYTRPKIKQRNHQARASKPKNRVETNGPDSSGKADRLRGNGFPGGREFGSTALLVKAGEIVAERAREEAEILSEEGKVEERMVTELSRVLKLLEMAKGAVKDETLAERVQQGRARCRQAILVAKSF